MGIFGFNLGAMPDREEKRQKCCTPGGLFQEQEAALPLSSPPPLLLLRESNHPAPALALAPPPAHPHHNNLRLGGCYDITSLYQQHQQQQLSHQSRRPEQDSYKKFVHHHHHLAGESQQQEQLLKKNMSLNWNENRVSFMEQHHHHNQFQAPMNHHLSSPMVHLSGSTNGNSGSVHEHLFYKVVTPSDVGKLNRLVIPKQHAERWFPLDPCLRKKGRLLSFQDVVSRDLWWFRYSYWSSSQSYVLTKGWIRFVKDKDLQAGDIISFERGARHELYINCRKRPTSSRATTNSHHHHHQQHQEQQHQHSLELDTKRSSSTLGPSPPNSSSEDEDDEEPGAVAQATRLFGVDLRAKPMLCSK